MSEPTAEFSEIVDAILRRFFAQNGQPPPSVVDRAAFGTRLRELIAERGLPRPLAAGEVGAPGGMNDTECAPLVARVAGEGTLPLLAEVARQLVKACFYPEFMVCRDSFREVTDAGACRRQELERVRRRVSGTHCVDCPHWVALEDVAHREFLAHEWRSAPEQLTEHRGVFLPEDFRALRRWLHAAARRT